MNYSESALTFNCADALLIGVLARPEQPTRRGVIIVVGGPQYRVGSHRQFLQLARALAAEGVPVLRFDYRGMGDSAGDVRTFEAIDEDLRCAIDTFYAQVPALKEVVIWGLCDAASAALMYAHRDARIAGLVVANPWVRTEAGLAETYVKHYYPRRLIDKNFWRKLLTGQVAVGKALSGLFGQLWRATGRKFNAERGDATVPFVERMALGVDRFRGPLLCILSGKDFTAQEFRGVVKQVPAWNAAWTQADVTLYEINDANHTFASRAWRDLVVCSTLKWLRSW
jgi:exosortase A-associated hydrolase 1